MEFAEAVTARRSEYMLGPDAPVDEVIARIRGVAGNVPSSFNSQTSRLFVLTGDDHRLFWRIVKDRLRERVGDPERFRRTEEKLKGFSSATGTILFYEVDSGTEALGEKYPTYRDMFPQWAEHGSGMMQFAVWVTIADMGLGANIQHYNPLIDADVAETFGIPDGYRLVAEMVFGDVRSRAGPKDKLSGDDIVSVAHAKM